MDKVIHIKGARVHNLKDVDVSIPREQLVAITGVSGSGKSSLAFDTLFAEGYRKFMDSLSTRARQLMEQIERPEVDFIEGLTPVVAIEQRTGSGTNPRSTVATITEIADYSRLLWSLCGEPRCPDDGGAIVRRTLDDCIERIFEEPAGSRLMIVAPYMSGKISVLRNEIPHLKQKGYARIRLDGEVMELDHPVLPASDSRDHQLDLVIDRIVLRKDQASRLADSLELAFSESANRAVVMIQETRDSDWREVTVSQHFACGTCGKVYAPPTPKFFSWDHPDGACSTCGGLGETLQFQPELVVPDPTLSVRKGAIKPWRLGSRRMIIERNAILKQLAEQYPFDPKTPWEELPEATRHAILFGTGDRIFQFKTKPGNRKPVESTFAGVLADLVNTRRETSSDGLRNRLLAYQTASLCNECKGARLSAYSRSVLLEGMAYHEFLRLSIREALGFVRGLDLTGFEEATDGLESRLKFLNEVGLHYLTLNRSYASLSGGESQRVRLATQVGMGLVGVTYVLDEPTVGLHPENTRELLGSLVELRDRGNSVVVVEHDPDIISASDHLIEVGPGAGGAGGEIVYQGTVRGAYDSKRSLTGAFLSGRQQVERSVQIATPGVDWLTIRGARENNLKRLDVQFPIGLLTVVSGVSGSGKSTLVNRILGRAAAFKLNRAKEIPGLHDKVEGLEHFDRVVRVDQNPIGRSPRSNPATFTKIFDDLRRLYAQIPLAKVRGYKPGRFSFNVRGGRCERCQGDGAIKMDMQFLSDVYAECPSCHGRRYNRETLEIRFKGYNIADALELTVDDAIQLFAHQPRMLAKLETLQAVGLGYIRLGQAAPTLSGGEAQRLKLSLELSKSQHSRNLYILDEPTTGLHWIDIQHLLDLLFRLREQGHTLVMIEHNIDVIRMADWVIDLGPGGGDAGGELLYAGPLHGLGSAKRSLTRKHVLRLGDRA